MSSVGPDREDRPAVEPISEPIPTAPPSSRFSRSERGLIFVLVAVQFTHMVDFVIVMPLGERLMTELVVSPNQFGLIVSAYAWAAGLSSLFGGLVIDRFDRKSVLLMMYGGFTLATLLCGLAPDYGWLLAGRAMAGACGGLAAVSLTAVIGDVFPAYKRGRAMGAVMSSFAIASVIGLPIGLNLAEWLGRGAPFVALAGVSTVVWVVGWYRLPAVRGHLVHPRADVFAEYLAVAREPNHLRAFVFSFFMVLGTFTIVSFIGPYFASTNGWSERDLAVIYLCAGACTLPGMAVIGRLADRVSRLLLFRVIAAVAVVMTVLITNMPATPLWVACVALSGFMVVATGRAVPAQAMLLGAASPRVRGAFLSLNTFVSHVATGFGPALAGALLIRNADGTLGGYPVVGIVASSAGVIALMLAGFVRPAKELTSQIIPAPNHGLPAADTEPKATAI